MNGKHRGRRIWKARGTAQLLRSSQNFCLLHHISRFYTLSVIFVQKVQCWLSYTPVQKRPADPYVWLHRNPFICWTRLAGPFWQVLLSQYWTVLHKSHWKGDWFTIQIFSPNGSEYGCLQLGPAQFWSRWKYFSFGFFLRSDQIRIVFVERISCQ